MSVSTLLMKPASSALAYAPQRLQFQAWQLRFAEETVINSHDSKSDNIGPAPTPT